ncbi:MAG: HEAT repeat domain-containing protein [Gemmatimonadetes bacterium]|nr:HEAT repeat domain-containing protein [Gemmatimonadota bacterium]
MSARRIGVIVALATVVVASAGGAVAWSAQGFHWSSGPGDDEAAGPDSARVSKLFATLAPADPLICDMITEQIGNFWSEGGRDGVGRFADAPNVQAVKDSLHSAVRAPGAIRLLEASLDAPDACTRRLAAKLLRQSKAPTAQIEGLLGHASARVREGAAYALATESRAEARVGLERLVKRNSGADAAMATWALGEQGAQVALPTLVSALAEGDARVKVAAAHAIGELHDLTQAPAGLVTAARSSDPALRRAAARSLAEIHDPQTLDALIELMSINDSEVRLHLVEALGSIGNPKAANALMKAAKDQSPEVRRAAVEALGEVAKET